MKFIFVSLLLVLITASGCGVRKQTVYTEAEKASLRLVLDANFLVRLDNPEPIFGILNAFSKKRQRSELVYRIDFDDRSENEAKVFFHDDGPHGGGEAHFKKSGSAWIQDSKSWYL